MAEEATLVFRTAQPIPFTCSNTVGIEKGTVLKLSDPMTVAASDGAFDIVAGIAASEKIANDGKTMIPVYRQGIFKMYLSGACVVGATLGTSSDANNVATFLNTLSGARVIGTALETGATGETILVDVNVTGNPLA